MRKNYAIFLVLLILAACKPKELPKPPIEIWINDDFGSSSRIDVYASVSDSYGNFPPGLCAKIALVRNPKWDDKTKPAQSFYNDDGNNYITLVDEPEDFVPGAMQCMPLHQDANQPNEYHGGHHEAFEALSVLVHQDDPPKNCPFTDIIVRVEHGDSLNARAMFPVPCPRKQENSITGHVIVEVPTSTSDSASNINQNNNSSETDLPFFMIRLVIDDDLVGKSQWELDVMRNEIYARHGRGFSRNDLQTYFDNQPWYDKLYEPADFPDDLLTDIEKRNVEFIDNYQQGVKRGSDESESAASCSWSEKIIGKWAFFGQDGKYDTEFVSTVSGSGLFINNTMKFECQIEDDLLIIHVDDGNTLTFRVYFSDKNNMSLIPVNVPSGMGEPYVFVRR